MPYLLMDDAVTAFRNARAMCGRRGTNPIPFDAYAQAYIEACTHGPVDVCYGFHVFQQEAYEDAAIDYGWDVPEFED